MRFALLQSSCRASLARRTLTAMSSARCAPAGVSSGGETQNTPADADADADPPLFFPEEARRFASSASHFGGGSSPDWSVSYEGFSQQPLPAEAAKILMSPINENDIEVKPDGLIYLPEIKYRRILNEAIGPGGWGLVPRGPHALHGRTLSREYALVVGGRLISLARGENDLFDPGNVATASEGAKSNALMRCCKDLGVASELWDPIFIRRWKERNAAEVLAVHAISKQYKRLWKRKDEPLSFPWEEKTKQ